MMYDVKGNLKQVLAHLPQNVRLVAISKYHPNAVGILLAICRLTR